MPRSILFFCLCIFSLGATAQTVNPKFEKVLADSLGADDYGMKNYVLVILKTGKYKAERKETDSLFTGHMQNIGRLVSNGKLVLAGPFGENDKGYRGIFILNAKTISEAKLLLDSDPAVKSGLLDPELFQWYGSAALPLYLKSHDKVKKMDF